MQRIIGQCRSLLGRIILAHDSYRWYTASCDTSFTEAQTAGPSENLPAAKLPRKGERGEPQPRSNQLNPYTSQPASAPRQAPVNARRPSPSYAPGSPLDQSKAPDWSRSNGHADGHGPSYDLADGYDRPNGVAAISASSPPNVGQHIGFSGMYGVQPTGHVTAEDALGYAMTAQYWAGYWLGVSRAKSSADTDHNSRSVEARNGQDLEKAGRASNVFVDPAGRASNVFVTRQQYHRPAADGLRR